MLIKKYFRKPHQKIAYAVLFVTLILFAFSFAAAYPHLFYSTVTFETNNGTPAESVTIKNGTCPALPDTQRQYNTFAGWFYDADLLLPYQGETVRRNTTLYAKWQTIFTREFFANKTASLQSSFGNERRFLFFSSDDAEMEDILSSLNIDKESYPGAKFYIVFGLNGENGVYIMMFCAVFSDLQGSQNFGKNVVEQELPFLRGDMDYASYDVLHMISTCGAGDLLLGELYRENDCVYLVNEAKTEVTLLRDNREAEQIAVPAEYKGLPVTKLGPGSYAGKNCLSLSLPDSLRVIGSGAFSGCSNLSSLDIPAQVDLLGSGFISSCNALAEIELNGSTVNVMRGGALYDVKGGRLIKYMGPEVSSYVVPEGTFSICDMAFAARKTLKQILFPEGLRKILSNAFYGCNAIETLKFPQSVLEIGTGAFCADNTLPSALQSVDFGENSALETLGDWAFAFQTGLAAITFPKSLIDLGDSAFYGCNGLCSIKFAEDSILKEVPQYAFQECYSLQTAALPNSVCRIAQGAFSQCSSLVSAGMAGVETVGCGAFENCSALEEVRFGNDGRLKQISYNAFAGCGALRQVFIPASIERMDCFAFKDCLSLESVIIENGSAMKNLSKNLFCGCAALKNITIPASVKSIEDYAFFGCSSLTGVDLGSVLEIGEFAFSGCTSLTDADLKNVRAVGNFAFDGCGSLTFADLGSAHAVGTGAFRGCRSLTDVTFCKNLEECGTQAFQDCASLTKIEFPPIYVQNCYDILYNPAVAEVTLPLLSDGSGGYRAFMDYFDKYIPFSIIKVTVTSSGAMLPKNCFAFLTNLEEVILPPTVTEIGEGAFQFCAKLRTVSSLPALRTVGASAFYNCEQFSGFSSWQSLVSVGNHAFYGCIAFHNPPFPSGLKYLGEKAFAFCPISGAVALPDGMDYVGRSVFGNCGEITSLRAPLSPVSDHQKYPESLRVYVDIFLYDFVPKLETAEITADTAVLPSGAFEGLPYLYRISLPQSVRRIEDYAFRECPSLKSLDLSMTADYGKAILQNCPSLEEVIVCMAGTAGAGLTAFGQFFSESGVYIQGMSNIKKLIVFSKEGKLAAAAFAGTHLKEIVIGEGLKEIPESLCDGCGSLTKVVLPESLQKIQKNAFRSCSALEEVKIPAAVDTICEAAFWRCFALKTVTIPNQSNLYSLGENIFYQCASLENISLAGSYVWRIPQNMFAYCAALQEIQLPVGLGSIEGGAFANSGLNGIVIPRTVNKINYGAFQNCASLSSVTFADIEKSVLVMIERQAFENCPLLEKIVFPKSLNQIVGAAFRNCTGLKEAYFLHEYDYHLSSWETCATNLLQLDDIDDGVFYNCHPDLRLYVPLNNSGITVDIASQGIWNGVSSYKRFAVGWNRYDAIVEAIPEGFSAV